MPRILKKSFKFIMLGAVFFIFVMAIGGVWLAHRSSQEEVYISETKKIILLALQIINKNHDVNFTYSKLENSSRNIVPELIAAGLPTPYGVIINKDRVQAVGLPWGRFTGSGMVGCDSTDNAELKCIMSQKKVNYQSVIDVDFMSYYYTNGNNIVKYNIIIQVPKKICKRLEIELINAATIFSKCSATLDNPLILVVNKT